MSVLCQIISSGYNGIGLRHSRLLSGLATSRRTPISKMESEMKQPDALKRENEALRDRLSRLSRASLQINESLDFDAVLQSVLDSACSLTGARCGVLTLLDETEYAGDFLSSGMTYEEAQRLWDLPDALKLYEYLGDIPEPFRHNDVTGHLSSLGLPEPHLPESFEFSGLLPCRAHPPWRGTRRQHLSGCEGGRTRVHLGR